MQQETPPYVPEPEIQKKNNTPLIIGIVVAVLLCCCCLIAAGLGQWLWNNGDSFFNLGLVLESLL